MDLGKATAHVTGVEVGGIEAAGVQAGCAFAAQRLHTSKLCFEVMHQTAHMMETFLARLEHISVDRRGCRRVR